jgi:hypothetical protein
LGLCAHPAARKMNNTTTGMKARCVAFNPPLLAGLFDLQILMRFILKFEYHESK